MTLVTRVFERIIDEARPLAPKAARRPVAGFARRGRGRAPASGRRT